MTLKALRSRASELGIPGRSAMNKAKLRAAVNSAVFAHRFDDVPPAYRSSARTRRAWRRRQARNNA